MSGGTAMTSSGRHEDRAEKLALLLRVSSEEQRDRETIEIQREFLQEYCRLYGLEVVQIYADDGVSGTIPLHERPEGRRLLEDAKEGKFSTLLVYRLDRLGRSLLVIVDAHDRLQAFGVALKSAAGANGVDPDVVRCQLYGHRLGQKDNPCLGGVVVGQSFLSPRCCWSSRY